MTLTRREVVDQGRLSNLRCALIALRIQQDEPELKLMHKLLDNWNGIGLISVGMQRQGMWLSLTHVADASGGASSWGTTRCWRPRATASRGHRGVRFRKRLGRR
jgi:hypothetical protein